MDASSNLPSAPALNALRGPDDWLRDFVHNANVGLHWVGPDGILLWANQAELDLLGYRREEYVGRHIADFHVDRSVVEDILARLMRGEELNKYPGRLRCKDGSIRHVLINSSALIEDGELIHTRCFTLDVTERKLAEERLRASEERYRRLTELLPVGVYTCEARSGTITYYNEHAALLWGRAPRVGDTDERFCGSFKLYLPDGTFMPHEECPMAVAFREGREFLNQEVIIERPDGLRITVLVNIAPTRDAGGRITGAVNVFHDISTLKQVEGALRAREERFRSLVSVITDVPWVSNPDGAFIEPQAPWETIGGGRLRAPDASGGQPAAQCG